MVRISIPARGLEIGALTFRYQKENLATKIWLGSLRLHEVNVYVGLNFQDEADLFVYQTGFVVTTYSHAEAH